ncbi:MAG: caspase domain-containing protein [Candidatus Odinarchaeota archaeon]
MKKKIVFQTLLVFFAIVFSSFAVMGNASPVVVRKVKIATDISISGDSELAVTTTGVGDGIVNRYALIIGISDYKTINDLSYCDEDATDWYNYLSGIGFQITLLGDHSSVYPQFDGLATEYNIKTTTSSILAQCDGDDIFVFASSGHGAEIRIGKGRDRTYQQVICAWDTSAGENGEDGLLRDTEFETMFSTAGMNVFIFLDHCNSGGMDEVMNSSANIYMATTCTADGYGYDVPAYNNGAWTYFFLEYSLIGHFGGYASMEEVFDYATANYPYDRDDTPQEFDSSIDPFYL